MKEKISPTKLRTLTKPGVYGDGRGLYLQVRDAGRRTWIYRYRLRGKDRWMGLGAVADVGLADAREAAREARRLVLAGQDPIDARRSVKAADAAPPPVAHTFRDVALAYIAKNEADWKNAKHRQQWANTLETYAFPIIGALDVAAVDIEAVRRVLSPIWREKPETASRLRGRIESVLDYAEAETWRSGDNPALLTKRLKLLLGEHGPKAKVEHHPALPWSEVGAFMATLQGEEGLSALALRFVILTATRTSETLNAPWREISLDGADAPVWTIPQERMKGDREHRVPLSDAALAVLREVARLRTDTGPDALVFPGRKQGKPLSNMALKQGKPLSNMALLMLLRRMKRDDLTAHGFRSTFRDWAAENTSHPREIAEVALAHALKDKTEAAYQRGDLLEKRRIMMSDWAAFCATPATKPPSSV